MHTKLSHTQGLRSLAASGRWLSLASAATLCVAVACGDDDGDGGNGGSGGSGMAGRAGEGGGGNGGSAQAGSAGDGGDAGSAGGGMGGSGGGAAGPTGTIQVLSADEEILLAPTTAAIRDDDVFVALGQLGELPQFGGDDTPEPFTVISLPLAGGNPGDGITLPGNDFYPEGIAAADDGTLYVGSITTGAIVSIGPDDDNAVPFIDAGEVAERGVVGMTVDDDRELLWFCDSSPVAPVPGGALVGVSLDDGEEIVRHELPNPEPAAGADAGTDGGVDAGADAGVAPVAAFCNDVRLSPDDDIFVTDSSGRIFRIDGGDAMDANSAEVWLEAPETAPPTPGGFGVNGLAFVGDRLIIANGGLFSVNPAAPAANIQAINLTLNGAAETLCGPDGIVAVPGTNNQIVVVENGFCPAGEPRVIRVTLDLD